MPAPGVWDIFIKITKITAIKRQKISSLILGAKIIDFGLRKWIENDKTWNLCGKSG